MAVWALGGICCSWPKCRTDRLMEQASNSILRPRCYWGEEKADSLSLDVFVLWLSCPVPFFNVHWCGDITCLSCCWHFSLVVLSLEAFPPSLPPSLPPSTINYINSSLKHPPSMLLHFVTGNLSAVTLWLLATLLHCTGDGAYSLFYSRLCSAIQFLFPTLDTFWWRWSIFMAVLMSSHFCLSLISQGTAYRKMNYTTQWKGWMFCTQLEANLP